MRSEIKKNVRYVLCVAVGVLFYLAAEFAASSDMRLKDGMLRRNLTGKGDLIYELLVEGLEDDEVPITITIPEQKLSEVQFHEAIPEAVELLCERILGENNSFYEICSDLTLVRELPEYGLIVTWESSNPEIVSSMGYLGTEDISQEGTTVVLNARLSNGLYEETIEIPVTVFPLRNTKKERFLAVLEEMVSRDPEESAVALPREFEGNRLTYRDSGSLGNYALIFLGFVAAGLLFLKEKSDLENVKKKRDDSLILDYSELVSRFLVLTGAGYPIKQAWIKQVEDFKQTGNRDFHPLYEEMEITMNQMATGTPESKAYGDFGRRLGLRCYIKFAALLESSLSTGGRNLRNLLEAEMEDAFKQRKDVAKKKGEEASTKLLIPMFLMLGIVMIMVVAPAFLSLG